MARDGDFEVSPIWVVRGGGLVTGIRLDRVRSGRVEVELDGCGLTVWVPVVDIVRVDLDGLLSFGGSEGGSV